MRKKYLELRLLRQSIINWAAIDKCIAHGFGGHDHTSGFGIWEEPYGS